MNRTKPNFSAALFALFAFGTFWLAAGQAHAFCVAQNGLKGKNPFFRVEGAPGQHFQARPDPNVRECCNWQEKSCNPSGQRDALRPLTMWQYTRLDSKVCAPPSEPGGAPLTCGNVARGPLCRTEMQAGGSARVRQEADGVWLAVYNIDGSLRTNMRCEIGDAPYVSMVVLFEAP
jgi:hypothetical protein